MDWLGEFFRALPDAVAALWSFSEGWYGVAVTVGSVLLAGGFLFAAQTLREAYGWLSAIFGVLAATVAAWWLFGILPSAWIYFMDGSKDVLAGRIVPNALDPVASNFYTVFRDLIVVVESGIAIGIFVLVALAVQKRYPGALAEGEESRPQSGGYK